MSKLTVGQHELLPQFFHAMEVEAHNRRENAGYSGSWGDGGARDLQEKVECWKAGLEGRIPDALKKFFTDFEKSRDPQYTEYLRLKERFEE